MVRNGLLSSAASWTELQHNDSDDDFLDDQYQHAIPSTTRKRRRIQPERSNAAPPKATLRALLGLTKADDYIETANPPFDAEPSEKDVLDRGVTHTANLNALDQSRSSASDSDSSSSDEEEVILPIKRIVRNFPSFVSRQDAPAGTVIAPPEKFPHVGETLLSEPEEDEEQALSISTGGSASLPHYPVGKSDPVGDESESSQSDDEVALAVKPKALANQKSASKASATHGSIAPAAFLEGQKPSFPVPKELRDVGPLVLGPGIQVPAAINRFLRSYQRDGVRFLYRSYAQNRGALLGDDMGLGKTIQVIAFLSAIMLKTGGENDENRRIEAVRSDRQRAGYHCANAVWPTCLIICPSSVIDNWRHELDTWGYFEHAAFSGVRAKEGALESFRRGRLDILVTSHETASLSIEQLRDLDFSCVLIDEAHKLKNPASQMTQAMQTFLCKVRFALTGTAIQNSYRELYTLADWTNPGLLGTVKEWITEIEDPLKHGQKRGADPERIADARTRAEKLVQNVLPIFFLRRTKALIADQLPRKFDKIVFCPLTPTQLEVYRRILAEPEVDLMKHHADPCPCGRIDPDTGLAYRRQNCCFKRDGAGGAWNKNMLKYVYLLQKCSNHVALVFPDPEDLSSHDPDRMDRYERQLSYVQLMFPDSWQLKRCNATNGMDPELCGKWKVLARLLQQWHADGDKVLLFSTNLRLLQFIEFFLAREGHSFVRLDGSTPQPRRQQLVDQFNRDGSIFVFLISTTAGGTGLNLTAANRVVVFDPHWNPSHDLQAIDRAYRFGQTRDVFVYRLIGAGSLEEVVYGRQLYKQQQMEIGYNATKERRYFEGVAGDQGSLGELFGCKNLFTLHESSLAMKSIIDECNISEVTYALAQYLKTGSLDDQVSADAALVERAHSPKSSPPESAQRQEPGGATMALPTATDTDPIRGILEGSGISYSHDHAALVGNSVAEAALYREGKVRKTRQASAVSKSKRATGSRAGEAALTSTSVWPPVRSAPASGSGAARSQEESQSIAAAAAERGLLQASQGGGASRLPDLSDLARLQNVSEVEMAAAVNAMSATEQKSFFDTALQRWNRKQDALAKGSRRQMQQRQF
jgi:SNF2 family DNA or RNA helicase